ncbi:Di-copper centre-containing protein [Trematosphaeria pertusa]|uniref:Di-copper centre-containing protein n=1 Tax=Trematosphaeria pertusa TaxID=390896 RepID=A0A6A6IQV5_9PLEO|nr:Di-copper centre-containing protein [Trematosphaeria pertusa]KAF2252924.1 Di-copper centre-containing protein [Trematosphaeria pertusa]
MRLSFSLAALLAVEGVSAVALPPHVLNAPAVTPPTREPTMNLMAAAATCANPRVRMEWDSMNNNDRQSFVNAVKCLIGKPASGQFSAARNRYEDLVALHQTLTVNVHNNSKFLIWHRYLLWTFEDILRSECGFTGPLPWFDETRYPGRFSQSSIFSSSWFGGIALGGRCVTDGQFAGLTLNIGPGSGNTAHCLARNGDASQTQNCNSALLNAINARTDYADMAYYAEGGLHAWAHNGIGAVMADVYASPGDPVFWLHHAFIDRNYRIWQNADAARVTYIDGTDRVGNPLTLDTVVSVNGLRPNVKVRDIINTLDGKLCYKYNY